MIVLLHTLPATRYPLPALFDPRPAARRMLYAGRCARVQVPLEGD
jgi:hypothetical protein